VAASSGARCDSCAGTVMHRLIVIDGKSPRLAHTGLGAERRKFMALRAAAVERMGNVHRMRAG
jgi:hypothetical protein